MKREAKGVAMATFARISAALERVTRIGVILMMAAMTCTILIGVFFRYVLNAPLTWPPEAARFMMVAITLLASSLAVRRGSHLRITILVSHLPQQLQLTLLLAGNFLVFLFLCVVLVEGYKLAFFEGPLQTAPSLRVPMTVAFVTLPLGAVLMIVQLIETSAKAVEGYGQHRPPFAGVAQGETDESDTWT